MNNVYLALKNPPTVFERLDVKKCAEFIYDIFDEHNSQGVK